MLVQSVLVGFSKPKKLLHQRHVQKRIARLDAVRTAHVLLLHQVGALRAGEEVAPRVDVAQVLREEPCEGALREVAIARLAVEAVIGDDLVHAAATEVHQDPRLAREAHDARDADGGLVLGDVVVLEGLTEAGAEAVPVAHGARLGDAVRKGLHLAVDPRALAPHVGDVQVEVPGHAQRAALGGALVHDIVLAVAHDSDRVVLEALRH
mmetsp:Transcript_6299/g.18883  ORF Transcript_6299/g.18883 Transcript_6299/m.18883 type:complete len:208 (-) Transcript_6299:160-783(-)